MALPSLRRSFVSYLTRIYTDSVFDMLDVFFSSLDLGVFNEEWKLTTYIQQTTRVRSRRRDRASGPVLWRAGRGADESVA